MSSNYEEYKDYSDKYCTYSEYNFTIYATIIPFLITHYLIQLLFFKIIIDYIVLWWEKTNVNQRNLK